LNTTRGRFALGSDPMTFTGTGEITLAFVPDPPFCTITYQTSGTRTSCVPAVVRKESQAVGWPDRWRQVVKSPAIP
jgi:hypothetical protein